LKIDEIDADGRLFIDRLRGFLIFRVILAHLGLSWFYQPYSSYVGMFLPPLFGISGAVTLYSYYRSDSAMKFIIKRLVTLLTTYYVVVLFGYLFDFISGDNIKFNVINFLIVNLSPSESPFHISQIWFLRSLVVITIIGLPALILSKNNINYLLIPIVVSFLITLFAFYFDFEKLFFLKFENIRQVNLYQPIICMGFFFQGAWMFASKIYKNIRLNFLLFFILLFFALLWVRFNALSMKLGDHSYYIELYFYLLGLSAFFLLMSVRKMYSFVLDKFTILNKILLFFNKHAFAIFLIHSFCIEISETKLNLIHVSGNLKLLPVKIIFVIVLSSLLAIPLTFVSKAIANKFLSIISCR